MKKTAMNKKGIVATILGFAFFVVCLTINPQPVHAADATDFLDIVVVNTANVNVRSLPDANSTSYGKLQVGTFLKRYEIRVDGWSCIDYAGVRAYIKTEFLTPYNATATIAPVTQTPGVAAVAPSTSGITVPASPAPAATSGNMVWISATGKKYHKHASCSNMNSPVQVPLSDALAAGKTACKRCYH